MGRVFSTDIVEVRLPLTDSDLAKLDLPLAFVTKDRANAPRVALSATIAGQTREWDGRIMRTDSVYDTQTRALFAIAEVDDPYGSGAADGGFPLAPGLFVNAELTGKKFDNVIMFPRDGLRPDNKVYVVNGVGKASIRTVEVLDTTPKEAILTGGIEEGELIVLSPMEPSRVEIPLKVYDIKNPTRLLVEPPRPDAAGKEAGSSGAGGAKANTSRPGG